METDGGGWTVFQRRKDGSVDFNRNWTDYEYGFGDLNGEFWLGLSKTHRLTKKRSNSLRVDLGDLQKKAYALYPTFSVGNSASKYTLTIEGYSGTAGDSLDPHNGLKFSTKDEDNDEFSGNCAISYYGGWWFKDCGSSSLNNGYQNYIYWSKWNGFTIRFTEMKTRRNN